ncbi:hypothetical protein O7623_00915 [Solwaraspora sp. WMMD791]|uniref:hypothetical protein n=1 Tax=Solwaraspora sp. WMMD791 TaxID=3016086 RepID=UPI00249C183B|nr:hypothetical protein [Solwaraspora sp. WMMD791]WFE27807.1 hypothetical protein O7623_00915 [Solwaraspora sp. WMMD791]
MTGVYEIEIEAGQEWFFTDGTVPVPAGTTPEQIRDQVAADLAAEAGITGAYTVTHWRLTPVRRNTR